MNVVGLDLSLTSTGVARADGTATTLSFPKLKGVQRLDAFNTWICGAFTFRGVDEYGNPLNPVDLVVIESYSFGMARPSRSGGGQPSHAHALGELGGVVRLALWEADIAYVDLPPACLKKLATGKGNASKDEVFAAAIRRLGYEGNSHDEADALWCREAALQYYGVGYTTALPATHLEGLVKVQWPMLTDRAVS